MRISTPEIIRINDAVEYRAKITIDGQQKILWYRVPAEYVEFISPQADAALVAMLIPAMLYGEDITVDGPVSPRLYANLSLPVQHLIKELFPDYNLVKINAPKLVEGETSTRGVAAGYSSGVDSYCTINDYFFEAPCEEYKLTHLLFNEVGAHGQNGQHLFEAKLKDAKAGAKRLGLPLIDVRTNLAEIYPADSLGRSEQYVRTHTFRNASVALMLQRGIKSFFYSGGLHYRVGKIAPSGDITPADPILLPLISTEILDAAPAGNQYTRLDKVLRIIKLECTYDTLDICVNLHRDRTPANCGACDKCVRNYFAFLVAGYADKYKDLFDVAAFERSRLKHVIKHEVRNERFWVEIKAYAKKRNYQFLPKERLALLALKTPGLKWLIKKIWNFRLRCLGYTHDLW